MKAENIVNVPIVDAVKELQEYWNDYSDQLCFEDYRPDTLLDDAIYGIGVAVNPAVYKFSSGFKEFKKDLLKYLIENQ